MMTNQEKALNLIINEMESLVKKGYDPVIVENAFMDFFSGKNIIGSSVVQVFKKQLFQGFLSKLGLEPTSFMGQVLSNAFANVSFKDYYRLFTDCNFTTGIISKTLLESFIDKWRVQSGMDSLLHVALKEVLFEAATATQTYKSLSGKLNGIVCPILKDISSKNDLSSLKKLANI